MQTELQPQIKQSLWFTLLVVTVFLSRLPFLFNGYGTEEDSWGLVINSWDIAGSGHYVYSRLPGHPVQELVLAMIPHAGPFIYNLLSALFSMLAVVFFARIMKLYSFRYPVLAGFALAFTPVLYISSTYTIDYCWALAFIMMSYYFLLKERFPLAGLLLGISVGCRLTSALMFLPLLILLFELKKDLRWKAIARFTGFFVLAGLIVYLPAIKEYGLSIFNTYKLPYPPVAKVIYKGTFGVWGVLGVAALALTVVTIFIKSKRKENTLFISGPGRLHTLTWLVAVLLTLIIYFRFPEKSAFIIPALPFIILLVAQWIRSRGAFFAFCILSVLSSFILGINISDSYRGSDYSPLAKQMNISGQEIFIDPLYGPITTDYYKRVNKKQFTLAVIEKCKELKVPSLIIAGWWYNEIMVRTHDLKIPGDIEFIAHADEPQLQRFKAKGVEIYYLPEIDRINDQRYGSEFTSGLGKPFPVN